MVPRVRSHALGRLECAGRVAAGQGLADSLVILPFAVVVLLPGARYARRVQAPLPNPAAAVAYPGWSAAGCW
jgi:hypothetical protein